MSTTFHPLEFNDATIVFAARIYRSLSESHRGQLQAIATTGALLDRRADFAAALDDLPTDQFRVILATAEAVRCMHGLLRARDESAVVLSADGRLRTKYHSDRQDVAIERMQERIAAHAVIPSPIAHVIWNSFVSCCTQATDHTPIGSGVWICQHDGATELVFEPYVPPVRS
ncbi:MAG: hypothetical protein Q7S02_03950 [bacterium]|nr:hypothetical protein [bacterium]